MDRVAPENSISYTEELIVDKGHLDALQHVNNVVYLQWVNDVSEKHWNILSSEELRKKYFWVVLRHELDYVHQAVLGDQVQIHTWVGESEGVRSVRYVEMRVGSKVLLKARSTWCLIDAKTLRPSRIQQDVLDVLQ